LDRFKSAGSSFAEKSQNEFSERGFNAKWYGVKGDGKESESTYFDELLAMVDNNIAKHIFIPDGIYLISKTFVVPRKVHVTFSQNAI
ncbi:hypothetical protein, partial [Proteus faecis]|uniref:hypothetical protein n=1 Tax=Proteus faecis TaxID=2050967 RepID=UPI003075DACF